MADLLFVVITVAFVTVCVGYVRWCDRIIGPDPVPAEEDRTGAPAEVAA